MDKSPTMQFCPPPFQATGFPNCGQPCGFNAPIPNQINGYPDVIGEGNVASVISPDGSTQLLFFPIRQWSPQWRAFPQNPYVGNLNNPYVNTLGAWFVRNIYTPIQPTVFPQPHQEYFSLQYPRASASDCYLNLSPSGLPLKFHNDSCTSTSDIHYFVSKQFSWIQGRTGCASVQAACPVATTATTYDYQVNCTQPCNCPPTQPCNCDLKSKEKNKVKCMCIIKNSNSQMSIDSTISKRCRGKKSRKSKNSSNKCECIGSSGPDKLKNTLQSSNSRMSVDTTRSNCIQCMKLSRKPRKSKKYFYKCGCKEPSSSDKGVTTYAEQGIGCTPDTGQETQTCCGNSVPIIKVSKSACNSNSMCRRAETWLPKPNPYEAALSQSQSTVSICNVSNSGTSFCCTSGTE